MKLIRICALFVMLLPAVFLLLADAVAEEPSKVVRVGWFDSSYNNIDGSGRRTGYSYEYQQKIAAYTGWNYEYVEGNWGQLVQKLINGEIDMLGGVSYTEARANVVQFSSYPMGTEEYYLFMNGDKVAEYNEDFSYFNGKKIGVNKQSVQLEFFKEWEKQHNIQTELIELPDGESKSMKLLKDGEIDGFVSVDNYLSVENIVPVVKIGYSDFFFAVSKKRSDILDELNVAMGKIQDENRYYGDELFIKYIRNSRAITYLTHDEQQWLSEHKTIRVGYVDDYLAYCAKDKETEQVTGALKDYLRKARTSFSNGILNFETKAYDSISDAMSAMQRGEVDTVFPSNLSVYDAEEAGVLITPSIVNANLYLVVRASNVEYLKDMQYIKVAVVGGDDNYESIVKTKYYNWQIYNCDNVHACIRDVANGKAEGFLISNYRYNSISRLCSQYHLVALDTAKDLDFRFAVKKGDMELYSIVAKTTNIVPTSYVHASLTKYFSEEGKMTVWELICDNKAIVIFLITLIISMLWLIVVQNRLIRAKNEAKKHSMKVRELSHRVFVDALTSVRNKGGYDDYILHLKERIKKKDVVEFGICMFDCDNLKVINDKYGHEKGDVYLKTAAKAICEVFQHSPVFRIGGDEFTLILLNEDFKNRTELINLFKVNCNTVNEQAKNDWEQIHISIGCAVSELSNMASVDDVLRKADQLMYENKRKRKGSKEVR
ncbi:diguanylate cyclase (GGDEF) domain-containing protein [Ruminobacter amylophilus]|uniref:Diguanylate cyclase (GGDEF) domain-containing protein n=1 Tax=Ruminobacter amylophilus TaxID=867 RepID=A0A662ZE24_9GAMM|nr:GGDEF domain-containing protein [Ruminobacter amylophilus]SFP00291.1 diguanylate cyclase (GGDEF) domain-containing protein [Ruminobacter amylophilus]